MGYKRVPWNHCNEVSLCQAPFSWLAAYTPKYNDEEECREQEMGDAGKKDPHRYADLYLGRHVRKEYTDKCRCANWFL